MHYANKAEVADTFFSPSRTFLCIPQRGVIQVLKLCLGRCIQLPLENRFSEVLTAGSWWEEVYAVEPMWWLRVTGVTFCLALKFENQILKNVCLKCQYLNASGRRGVGGEFSLAAFHLV